jgi:hypothetical protein
MPIRPPSKRSSQSTTLKSSNDARSPGGIIDSSCPALCRASWGLETEGSTRRSKSRFPEVLERVREEGADPKRS